MDGPTASVLILVAALCVMPVAVVAWVVGVANKRMAAHARDLLKANLSMSSHPAAATLGHGMEATDRAQRAESGQRTTEPRAVGR